MKNLFNKVHLEEMKARVEKLNTESVARWGKFTVHRMVCHLLDHLEYALGITEGVKEVVAGPPMFIRHLVRLYVPFPRGPKTSNNQTLWEVQKPFLEKVFGRRRQ